MTAPAVHTRPAEQVAADEAQAIATEAARPKTVAEQRAELRAQMAALDAVERRQVLGARVLTPKQRLMDFTALEDRNPDRHYRWVNVANEAKAEQRRTEGYVAVSDEDVKGTNVRNRLGNEFVLMSIPKSQAEARVRRQEKLSRDRMGSMQAEMRAMAEQLSEQYSDRLGRRVDPEEILQLTEWSPRRR